MRSELRALSVPYVMALKPSHAWWHPEDVAGTLKDVAYEAGWKSVEHPGKWIAITRTFRDGSSQQWGVLEIVAGAYGPDKTERAGVATTDPETFPDLSSWYLITNLPAPSEASNIEALFPAADLREVIRLYGLRIWVEQGYKQVKDALGWADYRVRSDKAIRRHWQLVCCAFCFCCYHVSHPSPPISEESAETSQRQAPPQTGVAADEAGTGKKNPRGNKPTTTVLARRPEGRQRLAGTLDHAQTLLERLVASAPLSIHAAFAQSAGTGTAHPSL